MGFDLVRSDGGDEPDDQYRGSAGFGRRAGNLRLARIWQYVPERQGDLLGIDGLFALDQDHGERGGLRGPD